jgi:hypothetical protein
VWYIRGDCLCFCPFPLYFLSFFVLPLICIFQLFFCNLVSFPKHIQPYTQYKNQIKRQNRDEIIL